MTRALFWQQVPRAAVREALPKLVWVRREGRSVAQDAAAVMVYVALQFRRVDSEIPLDDPAVQGLDLPKTLRTAQATYEELGRVTGLSRSLTRQALERLEELGLIVPIGSSQKRFYELVWSDDGWFKLPCQAIVREGVIVPFTTFTLRSKHELNALKLYLYLASIRDRVHAYSEASYETIHKRIGVPERDIRRAILVLVAVGLLRNVSRPGSEGPDTVYGPNRYHLTGDSDFFQIEGDGAKATPKKPPAAVAAADLPF